MESYINLWLTQQIFKALKIWFMIILKIGKNCGGFKTKGFIFAKKKIF
jgi:hypothetical protein